MKLFQSTIGLKILMALSGLVGVGFVIGHMLGNLQVFLGAATLNAYAAALHANAALLWGARVVLLASVVVHVVTAVKLTAKVGKARPVQYDKKGWLGASYATRTMRWGGFILLAFIIYHLLHLTSGAAVLPEANMATNIIENGDLKGGRDVYKNVMNGFSFLPTAVFYLVAQVMLGLHLTHGIHSMSRSLGISNPVWTERAGKVAVATGVAITVGNVAIVIFGMITPLV
jgi:succinate dehydrogenase / fumarate reductase cytochrome b subunit